MMKSLISKTFSWFATCCIALFIVSAPLFYYVTKHYYAEDMADIIEAVEKGHGIPPLDLERDIMEGMMLQFVMTFAVVSVSLYVTMRLITRRLWLPFDDTLRKAESFNVTQGATPPFMPTDIKEFDRLNRSLEKMMTRTGETYRIQKEFTENASHELQTPLAVTRSKLDLLMQEELDEHTMEMISDLYSLNTRMGHLNRSLLLLARIDNGQYSEIAEVDPGEFIAERLPSYRMLRPDLKIEMEDGRTRAKTIKANMILLESLMNNLITNAIRHTESSQGEIVVLLTDDGITVSNPSGGKELDATDLFRRFGPKNPGQPGNGLGLAITKAICDYHGWTIVYAHTDGHHCFNVKI